MAGERNRTLSIGLAGIAVLYALTWLAYRLPDPKSAATDGFSALRARDTLKDLVGDGVPHPIGSAANARVRAAIQQKLVDLGYEVELQRGISCSHYASCGMPTNIIARRGAPAGSDYVLIAAHYDSVPAGPGAADDGAGVATLLEIARILTTAPARGHPVLFLFTDGEEGGLLGAELFVRKHPLSGYIRAAVNVEARGVEGPSLMFETGSANAWLMRLYGAAIARPITDSLFYTAYSLMPSDTDFSSFKTARYQGFNFAFIGGVGRYHTAMDSWQNLNVSSLQHEGDNALAAVRALAAAEFDDLKASDAVYLDVLSRALLSWSEQANGIAAIAVFVLFLVLAVLLRSRDQVKVAEILAGGGAFILALVGALLLVVAAVALAWLAGRVPPLDRYTWVAYPEGLHMASVAAAVFATCATASLLSKRGSFWGFWLAVVGWLSLSSLILAFTVPGMSFLFLLPAMVAVLAGAPMLSKRAAESAARAPAVLLPAWMYFAAVFPIVALLYPALGALAWPLTCLLLTLGAATLLPLLSLPAARQWRRRALVGSALAGLAGIGATLVLPTFDPEWPLRINFQYLKDLDAGRSFWIADPNARTLRRRIVRAGHFDSAPRARFKGGSSKVYFADAPPQPLQPPILALLSAAPASGGVDYRLHLSSPRGAPVAALVFPPEAKVREVELLMDGDAASAPLAPLQEGYGLFRMMSLPAEGVDLKVHAAGAFRALLMDQSFGLPGGEFLQALRTQDATSTQDGDVTVVQLTVTLDPAPGR